MERPSSSQPVNVLTLKVSRSSAGSKYPWDKVYLFKSTEYETIKRAFPYSITFRVTGDLLQLLGEVSIAKLKLRSPGRLEFETKVSPVESVYNADNNLPLKSLRDHHRPARGAGTAWEAASQVKNTELKGLAELTQELCNDVTEYLSCHTAEQQKAVMERVDWCQLIPILPKFSSYQASKKGKLRPSYLTNREWVARKDRVRQRARGYRWKAGLVPNSTSHKTIPDDAVLIINGEEEITPPCAACANLLNHVQGDCELGGRSCYEGMQFGKRSFFKRGLAIQEMLKTMSLVEAYTKYREEFAFYEDSEATSEVKEA